MEVRRLQNQEIVDALHLVWDVFLEEIAPACTPQVVEQFQQYIRLDQLRPQLDGGQLAVFGAYEGDQLIGAGAVHSSGHISLLFVRKPWQGKGAGRMLVQAMCQQCAQVWRVDRMTVNAYPGAEMFYRKMGFHGVGRPMEEKDGTRYYPMQCELQTPGGAVRKGAGSHKGLIIGVAAVAVVLLILLALLFGRVVQEVMRMSDTPHTQFDGGDDPESPFAQAPDDGDEAKPEEGGAEEPDDGDTQENETAVGIEAIRSYTEEDLPYTIREETYTEKPDSSNMLIQFEVKYPQIEGLEGGRQEEINQILKDCAMSTVNALYLDPSTEMKEFMLKQKSPVLASFVTYRVAYAGKDFISVAFSDEYYAGNAYRGYVHLRTRNIRLSDAKEYKVEDIVDLSDAFMQDWIERMRGEGPNEEVLYGVHLDEFRRVLSGEILDNRYYEGFFVDADGIEIGLTYHYYPTEEDEQSRQNEQNGWITAPFTMEEIAPYRTDSEFWTFFGETH